MMRAWILGLALLAPQGEGPVEVAFPHLKFKLPVCIAFPPDGTDRLFVVEQKTGTIRAFDNKRDTRESSVVLDIGSKIFTKGWEEGLLGLAFHPKFKTNGAVFIQYSVNAPRRNVLSRLTMNKERTQILAETEKIVLEIPQPFENHNGGMLQFGPDGFLYIGLGDGGSANDPHGNGQNMKTFLGKFLRIDVDREDAGKAYAVPPDNPFVGKPDILPEIWASGQRNPWGYSFDRKTGDLWSGDVGQDKWEEINIIRKGGNYGWKIREGRHPFAGEGAGPFVEPIVEHDHGQAKSITGGVVYRGKRLKGLVGAYVYGDFVTGNIWTLRWDGRKVVEQKLIVEFKPKQIACFGEDRDGDVYYGSFDGNLYRFR